MSPQSQQPPCCSTTSSTTTTSTVETDYMQQFTDNNNNNNNPNNNNNNNNNIINNQSLNNSLTRSTYSLLLVCLLLLQINGAGAVENYISDRSGSGPIMDNRGYLGDTGAPSRRQDTGRGYHLAAAGSANNNYQTPTGSHGATGSSYDRSGAGGGGGSQYTYSGGGSRNTINCYSCMSKYYEANWPILQNIYNKPMNFTDDCDFHASRPNAQAGVGLVKCDSVCIKMYEQSQIGGLYVNGFTRGCYDNMMRRGFNATLVKWYRWLQRDSCHEYSRRQILQLGPQAPDGVVTICTCYADGCNGSPRLSAAAGVQALIRWSTCLGIGLYVIYFSHLYWL